MGMRRFLSGCFCGVLLVTSSCATIDLPPSSLVSERGAQATATRKIGPWFRIGTASIVPGKETAWPGAWIASRCGDEAMGVELYSEPYLLSHKKLDELCDQVRLGLLDVMSRLPSLPRKYVLRAYLRPAGVAVRRQRASWASQKSATAEYVFPWGADARFSRANVVSTTAHESFHLLGALASLPMKVRTDESKAYLFGACAQIRSLGYLRSQDLPKGAYLAHSPGASESILASSEAGISLRSRLAPFFGLSDEILLPSAGATELLAQCDREPL